MKKITLAFFILFTAIEVSFAQVSQGSKAIGLNFEVFSQKEENEDFSDYSRLTFIPNVRFFVKDKISLGLGIGYQGETFRGENSKDARNTFLISPEFRFYKNTSAENFYFFGQVRLGLGFGKEKDTFGSISIEQNFTTFNFSISPGFVYFPTQKWGIELFFQGIGFGSTNPERDNNNRTTFNIGLSSFSPSIGVNYYF